MKSKTFIILSCAFVCFAGLKAARAQDPWGQADDVPTWQPGDSWNFTRTFNIDLTGTLVKDVVPGLDLGINAVLNMQDAYGLQVNPTTPVLTVNNGLHGFQSTLAYNRTRTSGNLVATGSGLLYLIVNNVPNTETLTLNLSLPSAPTTTGTNWIGVGDLAQIRDQFAFPDTVGSLLLTTGTSSGVMCQLVESLYGLQCGTPYPFQLGVDISVNHATVAVQGQNTTGGLETMDFPTKSVGETWTTVNWRGITGTLHLVQAALGLNSTVAVDYSVQLNQMNQLMNKAATDPNALYTNNRYVKVLGGLAADRDEAYYTPTAKELSYSKLGTVFVPGTPNLGISNFVTRLTSTGGVSVQPDGDITGVTLNPVQPSPGQAFTVSGTCSALGLTMGAQVLLPGGAGSSASSPILLGAFSIGLTAPVGLDNTRSIGGLLMESGSWGIQLTRTGGLTPPYPKKVVTVRTGAPAPTAARVWDIFE